MDMTVFPAEIILVQAFMFSMHLTVLALVDAALSEYFVLVGGGKIKCKISNN